MMFRFPIADAESAITILFVMVALPHLFSAAGLGIAICSKRRETAVVALIFGFFGFLCGSAFLGLTGFPRTRGWLEIAAFLQAPFGALVGLLGLYRMKKESNQNEDGTT